LVEDHPIVLEGIRSALEASSVIRVIGQARSAEVGIAKALEFLPDVIVMDVELSGMDGLEAIEILRREAPDIKVILLANHRNMRYVERAIGVGASGYLLKDAPLARLLGAVVAVADGQEVPWPEDRSEPKDLRSKRRSRGLTRGEENLLLLIASGKTTREIAEALGIRPRAARSRRDRLKARLEIQSTAHLTRFAMEAGLLAVPALSDEDK
jgi:DNA-binding NarL/FixJ family response regulator